MNTKSIIGVGIAIIVVVGIYAISQKDASAPETTDEANTRQTGDPQEEEGSFRGSIQSLIGRGQNMTCTFSYTDETGGQSSGTVYVESNGERMRADYAYSSTDANQRYEGSVIHDGTYVYTWGETEEGEFGIKMPVPDTGTVWESEEFEEGSVVNWNTDMMYDCSAWSVDASVFVPPSTVQFMDFGAQMEMMQSEMGMDSEDMKTMQCAACDSIPDESARAECRASLQCD